MSGMDSGALEWFGIFWGIVLMALGIGRLVALVRHKLRVRRWTKRLREFESRAQRTRFALRTTVCPRRDLL